MATAGVRDVVFDIRADDKTRAAFESARRNLRGIAQEAGNSARLSTQQLANMQFQLQDIAQGLATGQSPFRTILQQGSQIVQLFEGGTGLKAALKAFGAGVVSFVTNPLNIALAGFTAATAAASYFFSTVMSDGGSVEDVLERHATLVDEIRKTYGEAAKQAEDLGRTSREVLQVQVLSDIRTLQTQLRTQLRGGLTDLGVINQFVNLNTGQIADRFKPFAAAIAELRDQAYAGTPDLEAFRQKVAEIALTDPGKLGSVADAILKIGSDALTTEAKLREAIRLRDLLTGSAPGATPFDRVSGAFDTAKSDPRVKSFDSRTQFLNSDRSYQRSLNDAAAAAERAKKQREQVLADLRFEGEQLRRNAVTQEVYNQVRAAGVDIESSFGQAIRQAVLDNAAFEASQARLVEGLDQVRSVAGGALSAFTDALKQGKGFADSLKGALDRVLDSLLKIGEESLINGLFGQRGGTGGGLLGGFVSRLFGGGGLSAGARSAATSGFAGLFAGGGTIPAGKWGIAGERGPEPVVGPATVLPSLSSLGRRDRGGGVKVSVVNNNYGTDTSVRPQIDGDQLILFVDSRVKRVLGSGDADGEMQRYGLAPMVRGVRR